MSEMWCSDGKSIGVEKMKISGKEKELNDIEKTKKFLLGVGFVCNSFPSAQHQIYSKKEAVVIIKNKEVEKK